MAEKKKAADKFVHEDAVEKDTKPSDTAQPQALYGVGPGSSFADKRLAEATSERDRQALKDKDKVKG